MDEELDANLKDAFMFQIEELDLFVLIDNVYNVYLNKIRWDNFIEETKKIMQIIRTNNELHENFQISEEITSILNMSEEEYGILEQRAKDTLKIINLLENDIDVQKAICQRLKELNYDKSSEESKATTVQILQELLSINGFVNLLEKSTGQPVQEIICETIEQMSNTDVLVLYDWISQENTLRLNKVNDIFLSRMEDLGESEFNILVSNMNVEETIRNSDTKWKVIEKIKETNGEINPLLIHVFSQDDDFISALLPNVKETEYTNVLSASNLKNNHNEKVTQQLLKIIKDLSNEELVRYLVFNSYQENEIFDKVIQERMRTLSNDDLKFVFFVYDKMDPSYKETIVEDLLIERELSEEYDGIAEIIYTEEEEENYIRRFNEYVLINRLFNGNFPFLSGLGMGIVDMENIEESKKNVVKTYEHNKKIISDFIKFNDYLRLLTKSKDEDLYKIIEEVNRKPKIIADEDIDENIQHYYIFIALYLQSRIMKLDDEKFLNRLYLVSSKDSVFLDCAIVRMKEKGMQIPSLYVNKLGGKEQDLENEI